MSEWNGADYQKLSVANGRLRNLRSTIGKQAYEIKRLRSREAKLLGVVGKLRQALEISAIDPKCEWAVSALASVSAEMEIEG